MSDLPNAPDLGGDVEDHSDIDDPMREFRRCAGLKPADISHFLRAGVPVEALGHGPRQVGLTIKRDIVNLYPGGASFEFTRHQFSSENEISAYVMVAFDVYGDPLDLVAFGLGAVPFVASWLGHVGLLGEEQLGWTRDVLQVHAAPLDWLRAGRDGVVIVDPVRAAPLLRDAGSLEVANQAERQRVLDLMAVRLPPVTIRKPRRARA